METKKQDIENNIDENKTATQEKENQQNKTELQRETATQEIENQQNKTEPQSAAGMQKIENQQNKTEPQSAADTAEKGESQKSTSAAREILSWVITFALAIGAAFLIKNYLIINADVPTGSMENTIMPGDRLIGNRLAFLKETPERGDVVIFHYPDDEEELYVKRVIGLPGEEVRIDDGKIYIDGDETPLEEDYLKEEWTVATGPYLFEVPEDSYLVLGDNRNDSWDARYWDNKYVTIDKILGKGEFIYWPMQDFGKIR